MKNNNPLSPKELYSVIMGMNQVKMGFALCVGIIFLFKFIKSLIPWPVGISIYGLIFLYITFVFGKLSFARFRSHIIYPAIILILAGVCLLIGFSLRSDEDWSMWFLSGVFFVVFSLIVWFIFYKLAKDTLHKAGLTWDLSVEDLEQLRSGVMPQPPQA